MKYYTFKQRQERKEAQKLARNIQRRVSNAFKALRADGFVTDCGNHCCQSCTSSVLADGESSFAFYHKQDREDLTNHGNMYIAFGSFADDVDDESTQKIGLQVQEALIAKGLTTAWNGNPDTRIFVTGVRS